MVATVECAIIDFAKEVFTLVNTSVLGKVEAKDKQVAAKKNPQETKIVNAEPFVGSLCGKSCAGSKDGRNEPSGNGERTSGRFKCSADSDGLEASTRGETTSCCSFSHSITSTSCYDKA